MKPSGIPGGLILEGGGEVSVAEQALRTAGLVGGTELADEIFKHSRLGMLHDLEASFDAESKTFLRNSARDGSASVQGHLAELNRVATTHKTAAQHILDGEINMNINHPHGALVINSLKVVAENKRVGGNKVPRSLRYGSMGMLESFQRNARNLRKR